jgi:hypothetical protein
MADVPEQLRDLLYAFVLDRIAVDELPPHNNANGAVAERVALFARNRPKRAV